MFPLISDGCDAMKQQMVRLKAIKHGQHFNHEIRCKLLLYNRVDQPYRHLARILWLSRHFGEGRKSKRAVKSMDVRCYVMRMTAHEYAHSPSGSIDAHEIHDDN